MANELKDRVAIVTCAGGGLGRSHALMLARHCARVVVNDRDGDAAARVAAEIVNAGGLAMAAAASVTDQAEVAAMVDGATSLWAGVEILVNNAGILRAKRVTKLDLANTTSEKGSVQKGRELRGELEGRRDLKKEITK